MSWHLRQDDPNAIRVTCPFDEKDSFENELTKDNAVVFLGYNYQGELEVGGSWLRQGRVITVLWTRGQQEKDGKKVSHMTRDQGPPLPTADAIKMGKIKVSDNGVVLPEGKGDEVKKDEKPPEEKPEALPIPA